MSKMKKYVISILFLVMASILLLPTMVQASLEGIKAGTDRDVLLNYNTLADRKDLYCVQHNGTLKGSPSVNYTLRNRISIKGNNATDENGSVVNSRYNGMLAYITSLNEGYGTASNYTGGQKALYALINDWYANVGLHFGVNWSSPGNNQFSYDKLAVGSAERNIYDSASAYAEKTANSTSQTASDTTENKDRVPVVAYTDNNDVSSVRVGPFKWNFSGSVTDMKVTGNDNQVLSYGSFRVSRFVGNQEIWMGSESEIQSGEDFYITLKANSGLQKIKNISATIQPAAGETEIDATVWFLSHEGWQYVMLAESSQKTPEPQHISTDYDIPLIKNLKIIKVDEDDNKIVLPNVKFYIQSKSTKKYLKQKGNNIEYVENRKDATEFFTNSSGVIQLNNVIIDEYVIYEVENPNYGYVAKGQEYVIPADRVNFVAKNKQIYVKISGYVWQDMQAEKTSVRNDLYKDSDFDKNDKSFNGIKVSLVDNKGKTVKETTETKERGLYGEIKGGEYQFKDVLIENLDKYHIEFEYNGLIYQSVIPHIKKDNGSKASDSEERETLDKNFGSVEGTGKNKVEVKKNGSTKYQIPYGETKEGKAQIQDGDYCMIHAKTNDKEANYNIKGKFKPGVTEIKYINLGLYEKPQTDLALMKDLYNVDVGINGYQHVYNYASRFDKSTDKPVGDAWNVGVKFKGAYGNMSYRRAIYESDINYQTSDKNRELQVHLTYKIGIRNEESYTTRVNRVLEHYDSRYTLVAAGTDINSSNGNKIAGTKLSVSELDGSAGYKKAMIDTNMVVQPGKIEYFYVQFKLDRKAVIQIMSNNETLDNIVEIDSYTSFSDKKATKTVAVVDKDSVPGNTKPGKQQTYEDDTDRAPSVQLELANARKLTGTVFEDATSNTAQIGKVRQGDGIFNQREKTISNVKVTLKGINNSTPNMASVYTNENGEFEIVGYIPGDYKLVYTWGDKTYQVQDYKGTVYQSNRNRSNPQWFRDNVDTRYTDALDDYAQRTQIDKQMAEINNDTHKKIAEAYNGNNPDGIITSLDSVTPKMGMSVENTSGATDGTQGIDRVEYVIRKVDFGVAQRAKQRLDIDKGVKSFKITLANGQPLIDAVVNNDGTLTGQTDYLTYVGPKSGGGEPGFIKAEMDVEIIQGATLEIGYEIKAINYSELDYMTKDFYHFGILPSNLDQEVVKLTPSKVIDFLDKDYVFDATGTYWEVKTKEELSEILKGEVLTFGEEDLLENRMILYTEELAKKALKPTETNSVELNVSKKLSSVEDITLDNDAHVVSVNKPDEPGDQTGGNIPNLPYNPGETVIVVPSTGADRNYGIWIGIGVTSLLVLAGGVYFIKKKIIDNK